MIHLHWTWIVFFIITAVIIGKAIWSYSQDKGGFYGYSVDLETPFWIALLIVFILVWGGIFWW